MALFDQLRRDWIYFTTAMTVSKRLGAASPDMTETTADIFEYWARKTPEAEALVFEGRTYTYADFDRAANRFANWARSKGLGHGDVVSLLMENRAEYLFAWMGMAKLGVITALINTNLTGRALAHCLDVAEASELILGAELVDKFETARADLAHPVNIHVLRDGPLERLDIDGAQDLDRELEEAGDAPVGPEARPKLRGADACFYIYTSGTTGLPKAAKFPHMRCYGAMNGFSAAVKATARDRVYMTLPLYHSAGGVGGVGIALSAGGTLVLRRKFSVQRFWDDVADNDVTVFQYIGELCRYLLNGAPHPKEQAHRLRVAVGNGLRPDIWEEFQTRFAIPRIVEFYGSTEGNVTLFNYDGKPGAVGRIPSYARASFNVELVKFDVAAEAPVRGADGFCVACAPGETGEALGRIGESARESFGGYSSKGATEKKILLDVFEKGDAYFRTGDLMSKDKRGYFYFVDRIGDTFRWKGENVATSEVAEALSRFEGILEVNVYGVKVPHTDGRAGMANLIADGPLDLDAFYRHAAAALPAYARPVFLRVAGEGAMQITGTFKHRKVDLVKEGFDLSQISDPVYLRDDKNRTYIPLTDAMAREIEAGDRVVG